VCASVSVCVSECVSVLVRARCVHACMLAPSWGARAELALASDIPATSRGLPSPALWLPIPVTQARDAYAFTRKEWYQLPPVFNCYQFEDEQYAMLRQQYQQQHTGEGLGLGLEV